MKYISSKLIHKAEGRKRGKYLLTLEVTDYDMDMLEDLTTTYAPWDYKNIFVDKNGMDKKVLVGIEILDFNVRYRKWMFKTWGCFWKLWRKYDD